MPARKFRRRNNKKKAYRRPARRVRRTGFGPYGGFKISRLYDLISIKRNASGTFIASNTNVITLGTPVAAVSGVSSNYYDLPFSMVFRLDQLVAFADIADIADKYKIIGCNVKFHAGNTSNVYGGAMPYVDYCVDQDDDVVPTNNSLRQKMGVRQKGYSQMGQLTLPRFKPLPAGIVVGNAGGSGYTVPPPTWIDMAYTSVPHYGLKGIFRNVISGGASTDNSNFTIDVKLTLLCKNLQ